jgi:hypothetical protein
MLNSTVLHVKGRIEKDRENVQRTEEDVAGNK